MVGCLTISPKAWANSSCARSSRWCCRRKKMTRCVSSAWVMKRMSFGAICEPSWIPCTSAPMWPESGRMLSASERRRRTVSFMASCSLNMDMVDTTSGGPFLETMLSRPTCSCSGAKA
ncbi:hypothetical protein DO72_3846 [Burkholderia pseudomallei]|nr:hypothetical protein DO72_3846 [Burkholderia pseudomallei]